MNKYQEALAILEWVSWDSYYQKDKPKIVETFRELVNEKLEFESRAEKLVVGSRWECTIQCVVFTSKDNFNEAILTVVGQVVKITGFSNIVSLSYGRQTYLLPKEQFLQCFKPV